MSSKRMIIPIPTSWMLPVFAVGVGVAEGAAVIAPATSGDWVAFVGELAV